MIGAIAVSIAIAIVVILMSPPVLRSDLWRATATPLASIIGSGFLVSVPILRDLLGGWAIAGMAALLVVAYLIGAAVRENITHVEPLLADAHASRPTVSVERLSEFVLTFAYVVSVAFYLVLFSNFLLKPFGLDHPLPVKLVVTACLTLIGGVGLLRGFSAVERIEVYTVSIKLAVIGGLLTALVVFGANGIGDGSRFATVPGHFELASAPVLAGLLIVVQGFETSRFLGDAYSPALRVRSMRLAQVLAAGIYLSFFALMTPLLGVAPDDQSVAAIVDMLRPVAAVLPLMVILGALASQSSAAIADVLGAGGLLHGFGRQRINVSHTYPLIAFIAALVTWSTDVYSLITLASRCFALYYALQCVVATLSARRRGRSAPAFGYGCLAAVAGAIAVFGTPAEGG